jgi:hypothetical protein
MDEFLCIIHDKMDHVKTTLLRLQIYNKVIYGLGQLPIILTCMIAHGHEDKRYAQYLNELWPNDPNFTIGSLLWLFRTLEVASLLKSKLFLEEPPCITYSLHISYKGNYIAYINYAHKNKLLVPSLCQEICCLKWITK